MTIYNNRQNLEMGHWPELRQAFNQLVQLVWAEKELDEEFKTLRKDHEDLLVLLTDTDHKLKHYRKKVAATGEAVRSYFYLK